MKTYNIEKLIVLTIIGSFGVTGCSGSGSITSGGGTISNASLAGGSTSTTNTGATTGTVSTTGTTTGTTTTGTGITATGTGTTATGTGTPAIATISTTVPTADVIPGRIMNALTLPATTATPNPVSLVNSVTGKNFGPALLLQAPNLSTVTNPIGASGGGAVPLLAFAACNDVLPASYGVTTTSSLATESAAIVAAGLTIVNQCTAGLAAAGTSVNTSVTQYFTDLNTANGGTLPSDASTYAPPLVAASPVATTSQAFISVCTAAVEFCTDMLSF